MNSRVAALTVAVICCALGVLGPASASAAAPAWTLTMTPEPANFAPGATPEYVIVATNVGAAPASGQSVLKVTLPKAWEIVSYGAVNSDPGPAADPLCTPPRSRSSPAKPMNPFSLAARCGLRSESRFRRVHPKKHLRQVPRSAAAAPPKSASLLRPRCRTKRFLFDLLPGFDSPASTTKTAIPLPWPAPTRTSRPSLSASPPKIPAMVLLMTDTRVTSRSSCPAVWSALLRRPRCSALRSN